MPSRWAQGARRVAGQVLEFLRPVDDRELVRAGQYLLRLARVLSGVSSVYVLLGTVAGILAGDSSTRALAYPLAVLVGFSGTYLFASSRPGRRHAQLSLFFFAVVGAASAAFSRLAIDPVGGESVLPPGVENSALVLPVVMGALAPWRPSMSLLLGAVSGSLHFAQLELFGGTAPVPGHSFIVALIFSTAAAVGNQVQRRLWRELDAARANLAAAEKVSAMGQMIAGIAHEVKTPLAATLNEMQSFAALTQELKDSVGHPTVEPEDLREIVGELRSSAALLSASTARAERFLVTVRDRSAGVSSGQLASFGVRAQLESIGQLLGHRARQARVELDFSQVDPSLHLEGDPGAFEQILINLVRNGIDACEAGGGKRVSVSARRRGTGVELAVVDDGHGVASDLRERIFAPFFTTRAASQGTGLGLYIGRDLAEGAFGGTLELESSGDKGARFVFYCPDGGARVEQARRHDERGEA